MAQDFGNGVSRTLSALERQFQGVVWQASKPPLDSELNLMSQVDMDRMANIVRSQMHSGFLSDPMSSDADFVTNAAWSNWFVLGRDDGSETAPIIWANVNGWVVPVCGSAQASSPSNRIDLFGPPATDSRIDLVFLEVWQAQLAPNPSTLHKPSASTIYKYGNTQYGGSNLADDMEDPTIGFETTERLQIQYRIRIMGQGTGLGDSVDLAQYPDGLNDPNVVGQGAATTPVAGYPWSNMGDALGDRGLWRCGDGQTASRTALGTVDGYSYAIPICAVFRRNSNPFVARTTSGNANQNGSLNRNPTSSSITTPAEAARTFSAVTLTSAISAADVGNVSVTGLSNSGLDNVNINWSFMALRLGDEIIVINGVDAANGTIEIADPLSPTTPLPGRGRFGTQAVAHAAGTGMEFFNFRPDGRFADQINTADIMDLRRSVSLAEWSYEDMLKHNLGRLLDGSLRTSYKQGYATDTEGLQILSVDTYLGSGSGTVPNQTAQLDGFDGIRTHFSDAAVVQNDISVLLTPNVAGAGPTSGLGPSGSSWGVAPGFNISGFQPGAYAGWENGTLIDLHIGGTTGAVGARATSVAGTPFMRFVSPREYWLDRDDIEAPGMGSHGNQMPFLMGFPTAAWSDPAAIGETFGNHPGPMYPLPGSNFERPFLVLGGVASPELAVTNAVTSGTDEVEFPLLNFDDLGGWRAASGAVTTKALTGITYTLLYGTRNLWDLLTNGGRDVTGASSELYLTLSQGTDETNAGVFRVIGAGTGNVYSTSPATAPNRMKVERIGPAASLVTGKTVTAQGRTQYMNTQDGHGDGYASAVICITDIGGVWAGTATDTNANPWNGAVTNFTASDMVLGMSVLYGPSRGAMQRVPDALRRFSVVNPTGVDLVREAPENIDPDPTDFRTRTGVPEDEYYFDSQPLQTWNRLPSLGLHAPMAPAYGSGRFNFETYRESELLVDTGSKTVVFRPLQQLDMSLPYRATSTAQLPTDYTAGAFIGPVDGAANYDADCIYSVPPEYMPRFGRQDIPIRATAGLSGPYVGINHLFGDSETDVSAVFDIIGGVNNLSSGASSTRTIMRLSTAAATGLDYGAYGAVTPIGNGYQGRWYTDVNGRSSDINKPMSGIQLPPFLGIARVYGVYDYRDYVTAGRGSAWLDRGFTPDTGVAAGTNLLRTSADKQTLFIVKDGAADVFVADESAHTYVVPEEAFDISLSPEYVAGETPDQLEYVIEMAVFGFTPGFIDANNHVLLREDSAIDPGATAPALTSLVRMILPAAMPSGQQGYSSYLRTVYQGDPYMTRDGATMQQFDYQARYGQAPVDSAYQINFPVQQYYGKTDPSGDYNEQVPEIPNARAFEVLASVDFWTTLGTGKMGGPVSPGTVTDVGGLGCSDRLPDAQVASGAIPFQPRSRTFTEAQPLNGGSYAQLQVRFEDMALIATGELLRLKRFNPADPRYVVQDLLAVVGAPAANEYQYFAGDSEATAKSLASVINDTVLYPKVRYKLGVVAHAVGGTVVLTSYTPGSGGADTQVQIHNAAGTPATRLTVPPTHAFGGFVTGPVPLAGGVNLPMNAKIKHSAVTPLRLTGMTDRLPVGILVNDSDFLGEDPLRVGMAYNVISGGGDQATTEMFTYTSTGQEFARMSGPSGYLGMADGAILKYTAYDRNSAPDGTKKFRLYRGGGSAYVLNPAVGGPVDYSVTGFPESASPVLKGAVLAGRAYLVRNGKETAFTGNVVRSYGDEVQMVIVTNTIYGDGPAVSSEYAVDGIISPTDYGKGYAAADRYRLEGKPLVKSRAALPDPNVELAPYPPEDPVDDDPCA
jgi:hypothetical protein